MSGDQAPLERCDGEQMNTIQKRRQKAFVAQSGLCYYCMAPMWLGAESRSVFARQFAVSNIIAGALECTAAHLEPRAVGGANSDTNIVAACKYCNQKRGGMCPVPSPKLFRITVAQKVMEGRWHGASHLSLMRHSRAA